MDLREEATMNQYYALIGDIIESRSLANRARMQEALSQALNGLNERYQGHLASCFSLTLGDEWHITKQFLRKLRESLSREG